MINRKYFDNVFKVNFNNNNLNIFLKQNQELLKKIMIVIC